MVKYNITACGGTFDLFHKGHELFLKKTLETSDKILIGITSNNYIKVNKNNLNIEDFKIRKQAVENFLKSIGERERVKIVAINNAFEPYLETSRKYKKIIVTPQTYHSALEINLKRKKNNIPELETILVPFLNAEDGKIISSTRIRNGEINREGKLYVKPEWKSKNLVLPKVLRENLQSPWGKIIKSIPKNLDDKITIVVGDACVLFFNKKNRSQFLSIIDFLIKREVQFKNISELGFKNQNMEKITNPSGMITYNLFNTVIEAFQIRKSHNVILINGEDDLAVLPVILVAPIGFNIIYGQPNVGMVHIINTEDIKEKAFNLINKFIVE